MKRPVRDSCQEREVADYSSEVESPIMDIVFIVKYKNDDILSSQDRSVWLSLSRRCCW